MDSHKLMQELGLGDLPPEHKAPIITYISKALRQRVGLRITRGLSDEQMASVQQMAIDFSNRTAISRLKAIYPGYREVFEQELERLKIELRALKLG